MDLFSLDEIKEILQNPATPEIENYLTQFLGKFDITDKDDRWVDYHPEIPQ